MTTPSLVSRFHVLPLTFIFAFAAVAVVQLPAGEGLVMHWDMQGQPDWIWPRNIAFALVPAFAVAVTAAFAIGGAMTPKNRLEMARHVLEPALTAILSLCTAVQLGLLALGLGSDLDILRVAAGAVAVGLLFLGILLREAERHTYAGLRLPWRIPDDRIWRRTHEIAGWGYIGAAIVLAGLTWLQAYPGTLVTALPFALFVPVVLARLSLLGQKRA
ncbi:hypothetical protein XM25_05740 [Devosia sp. H5989]|nr:hypothetical protein XM25_05740 [Devosia sp. H5989]